MQAQVCNRIIRENTHTHTQESKVVENTFKKRIITVLVSALKAKYENLLAQGPDFTDGQTAIELACRDFRLLPAWTFASCLSSMGLMGLALLTTICLLANSELFSWIETLSLPVHAVNEDLNSSFLFSYKPSFLFNLFPED